MRVYISADLEGVAGLVSRDTQMGPDGSDYQTSRVLMTEEVNAVIRGVLAGGATRVVVNDSHGRMGNIIPDRLHPAAQLSQGYPKLLYMMDGVDGGFDLVFFVGYHARIGTADGILNHSYNSRGIYGVRVNGKVLGEPGLNARLAGYFGVPVAFVAGDEATVGETLAELPDIEGVVTKYGLNRYAARSLSPAQSRENLEAGAKRALERATGRAGAAAGKPWKPALLMEDGPVKWEVELLYSAMVDLCTLVPGVRRTGGRSVEWTSADYLEGFKAFLAMTILVGTIA